MKKTTRILSLLLCMALILGMIPVFASAAEETTLATFTFTPKASSGWQDGTDLASGTSFTADGYTLTVSNCTKVYKTGNDGAGRGFIKFGTSSVVGTLTFEVPEDVTRVELQLAGYKAKTSKYNVNGATGTLTKQASQTSAASPYDVISVDTSAQKTVTVSTVSGACRMVMFAVIFYGSDAGSEGGDTPDVPACEHLQLSDAIHVDGKHVAQCEGCEELIESTEYAVSVAYDENGHNEVCTCGYAGEVAAHAMSDWTVKTPATAAAPGEEIKTCSGCAYTLSQEIPQLEVTGAHYVKVSGELLSGTYILVAGSYAMGDFQEAGNSDWILNTQPPVIDDNTVADDMGGVWTLTVTDNGVMLTSPNGVTVAPKAGNTNGITAGDYYWDVIINDDGTYFFKGVGSDTTILAMNTDATNGLNRFRAYKTSTVSGNTTGTYVTAFTLYKLEGEVSCDHDIVYTTTATTHISACSKCGEVFVEESLHDIKGENGTCSICGEVVDQAALTAAILEKVFALGTGEKLEGSYALTGTVTKINYTFDADYKNMSVTIAIEGYEQTIYCYRMKCTAAEAAAIYVGAVITVEGPFENYNGTFELNAGTLISMVPCEHEYTNDCDADCNICGATRDAGHVYDDNCDFDCNVCEEFRSAPHNLGESVPAVIPANCQETGHEEYWICADCGCYFMSDGMGGYYETNPAWINYTGEHVRPEGAAGCAVVACTLCGEDSYGTESCVRDNTPACQDGTCVNCGGVVYGEGHSYGYDEETWESLIPLCQAGDCIYCGEHLDYIYECENGSYAPCSVDGECVYGCGKQYPATGVHALDNPCEGGLCWQCWETIEGAHSYDNDQDADCNVCGATREVGPAKDANLKFMSTPSLSFQDYIGIQLMMTKKLAGNYDKVYVVAVQVTPEGEVTTTLSPITYLTNYYVFDQQIMAWSMTETVTLTLYAEKDGVTYVGDTYTASVESLALGMLEKYATNDKVCRMLVDMLNYGAAVQTQFNHNAANLPNTQLGNFAGRGTADIPVCDATNSKTGTATVNVINDSVSMQAKVEIQLVIKGAVTHTPKASIGDKELAPVLDTTSIKGYTVIRVAIAATNLRDTVTVALYDAEGNPVTQVYNVSVEGYAVTAITGSQSSVVIAMMRYGDSVKAYATK